MTDLGVAVGIGPALFLVVAGVAAGAVATAGGIASLVSYPALLLVGVPALPANVVNIVAFAVCGPGSALTSRRELRTSHACPSWAGRRSGSCASTRATSERGPVC